MKRIIVIAVSICVFFIACGKKMNPAGTTGKGTESGERQKNQQSKSGDASANDGAPAEDRVSSTDKTNKDNTTTTGSKPAEIPTGPNAPNKPSAEEMGKSLYSSKCTKCHGSKNVKNYTLSQWEPIMKSMSPNAKLTGEEEEFVYAYIRANAKK